MSLAKPSFVPLCLVIGPLAGALLLWHLQRIHDSASLISTLAGEP
jgi:hypothetical protein